MKKKGILLVAAVLLSTAGFAQAQEPIPPAEGNLGVTFDVTYMSRYIWRGFDVYKNNHSAIQPSIDIDWYGTGFGTTVFHSRANRSGFVNCEELDITLYYYNSFFEGEAYQTDYRVGWTYFNFPDEPRKARDMQEVFAEFSWPEICPAGIVPHYTAVRMWPARSNASTGIDGGWLHIFGLSYDWAAPGFMPGTTEQIFHFTAETIYNDGAGPCACRGAVCPSSGRRLTDPIDHDWSHAVFGVSTEFDCNHNLTIIPGIYYQSSWDDSVNSSDECWVVLAARYNLPNHD